MRVCNECYKAEGLKGVGETPPWPKPARFLIRKLGHGGPQESDILNQAEVCTEHTMPTIEFYAGVGNKSKAIIEVVPL